MKRIISIGKPNSKKIQSGVNIIGDAVRVTLGPRGRTVMIEHAIGAFIQTKDGVTVAKNIELEDPLENAGCSFIRDASLQANETVGDGTTTAVVLGQEIVNRGLARIRKGINPIRFNQGMKAAVDYLVEQIKINSIVIKDDFEKIKQVAAISGNNDAEIGELLANCMKEIGTEGMITLEQSPTTKTYHKRMEGMFLDSGMMSERFTMKGGKIFSELQTVTVGDKTKPVLIVLLEDKVSEFKYLMPIMKHCAQEDCHLLIIGNEIDGEALSSLGVNHIRKLQASAGQKTGVICCAVETPGYGESKIKYLRDIAVITGAKIISSKEGTALDAKQFNVEYFGKAEKVLVTADTTTIIGGDGNKEQLEARLVEVREELELATENFHRDNIRKRIARMTSGIGIIYIGGFTRGEVLERKFRIEDAVCATRAAIEEGIVAGGGSLLAQLSDKLLKNFGLSNETWIDKTFPFLVRDADFVAGIRVIAEAICKPLEVIANNGGFNGKQTVSQVKRMSNGFGFDANSGVLDINMIKAGIIDPAKVTRIALECGYSVASTLLTTECTIGVEPIDRNQNQRQETAE